MWKELSSKEVEDSKSHSSEKGRDAMTKGGVWGWAQDIFNEKTVSIF